MIITIVTLSYLLPSLYWQAFDTKIDSPYFMYSSVKKGFMTRKFVNKVNTYWDNYGQEITMTQYEKALPMVYYRQLSSNGTMPDSLFGQEMDIHTLAINQAHFLLKPAQISMPDYGLYPLFESASGRVNLEMPQDYFRIGKRGMEFIDATSNKVLNEKSKQFSKVLTDQGFIFPAKKIAGIPTTRKSRDDGYFVLDAAHHLFHLKMVGGNAEVNIVPLLRGMRIKHIACVDLKNREYYCYVVTEDSDLYVILYDTYEFVHLPISGYKADEHNLRIMNNLFNKQITVSGDDFSSCFALDRDYKLIDQITERWEPKEKSTAGIIASLIFPVTLNIKDANSTFRKFQMHVSGNVWFILVNLFFVGVVFLLSWSDVRKMNLADLIIVAFTGLYGLIARTIFSSHL